MLMRPIAVSVLCVSVVLAVPASAQTACLKGKVTNASGDPVSQARITLVNSDDQPAHTVLSRADGAFQACEVAPGHYSVTAAAPGISSEEQGIDVRASAEQFVKLTLSEHNEPMSPGDAVGEFRYSANAPADLPDAPSGMNRKRPQGEVKATWGSGMVGRSGLSMVEQFPLAQFSGAVGGDLGNDRTSYFARIESVGVESQTLLGALAEVQARAAKPLLISPTFVTGISVEGRLDHRFSERDSSYLRFERGKMDASAVIPAQNGFRLGDRHEITQTSITAGNTVALSPNTVNESRAAFIATEMDIPAGAQQPAVIAGVPTAHHDRVFEAANNIYRQIGGESLKLGGDFLLSQMNLTFLEAAAQSTLSQSGHSTGLYVVSERQVRPNLLLTSGVRYELSPLQGFKTDHNRMTPQAGLAWSPTSRTVLRGGGGIYYDQAGSLAIADSGNLQNSASLRGSLPSGTVLITSDPTVRRAYVETANLEVEQQLSAHTSLSANYQFARGLEVVTPIYQSSAICASADACRERRMLRALEVGSGAQSNYEGFDVVFTQEPVRWGSYKLAYTYAASSSSGFLGNETELNDLLRKIAFNGVVHTSAEPAAGIWQHFTRGLVLSGGGDFSNRSEFTGINFLDVDARLTKTLAWGRHYRLDALAESMNSFERTSAPFLKSMGDAGNRFVNVYSTFRAVASLQGPTATQFGLRLGF